jgi:hypothetical protein
MKIAKELKGSKITVYLAGGAKITGEYKTTLIDKSVSEDGPVVIIGLHVVDSTKIIAYGKV